MTTTSDTRMQPETGLGDPNIEIPPNPIPLTRGQVIMNVQFNPDQRKDVAAIKQIFADTFDEIEKWVKAKIEGPGILLKDRADETHRLADEAKVNLETAQMYAVKAVTR